MAKKPAKAETKGDVSTDKDVIEEAVEAFQLAQEHENDNRQAALDDLRFLKLNEHWPDQIRRDRELENRPCLTIPLLPAFVRSVTNDARQNSPTIKCHPVDSKGDVMTARVFDGLIRNIEQISNADVAYDTAIDFAVSCGVGYWRLNVDYAHDDTFDKDILIKRIENPFNVYGDPFSTEADGSDWNTAFIIDRMKKDTFETTYKGAEAVDWEDDGYSRGLPWVDEDSVMVAEYWTRTQVEKQALMLTNGEIVLADEYAANKELFDAAMITVKASRKVNSWKVNQKIMTSAEVLSNTDWAGCYIPIVPVYGEEVNVEGKRILKSLIRDAKDAQRQFNYWRTTATELVALAPKAPFIGPEAAFEGVDAQKWDTANIKNHAYIAYKGNTPPQRMPFAGPAGGAIQEAISSQNDIKDITGIYNSSLGAPSNEISGKAINARKVEGDVATFHFVDNQVRAIRQTGKILIDLIPKVYTGERMIRVLGPDGTAQSVQLGQQNLPPMPMQQGMPGQQPQLPANVPLLGIFDLSVGKYDLTVTAGPNYQTQRQEAADQMMQLVTQFPAAAPVIGDLIAKNLDWPGADEIADRLRAMNPAAGGVQPEQMQQMQEQLQSMQQQMQAGMQKYQELQQQNQQLQIQLQQEKQANELQAAKLQIDSQKNQTEAYKAQTDRLQAEAEASRAQAEAMAINVNAQQSVGLNDTIANLAATTSAIHQHLASQSMPRVRRARKLDDGSWVATEEPAVMQ